MKLQQIIINVLSNAVKFTPQKGSITLDIRQISSNEKNAKLQFTIRDTGCGIGREFLPQIFNAFSQEYSGSTSCYGGTGLGLSICKNLVALMDGKIDVNSELGKGTEFIIVVKVGRYNSSHYADKFDFSKCNLLLVHDDDHIAKHRLSMLRDIGVNVKLVKNQSLCIESLVAADKSGSSFDIVLLDNRENLDGDTIAKKVRETANIKQTYIINTSFSWDNTNSDAQAAGVDFILPKPMFKPPLKKAILDAMSGKKADSNENVSIDDYDFSGKRILLVEDHPLNIEVAKKLLQIKGPEIECAVNGKNAVDMFETSDCNYYDLVLMDIRMP
ncbi:MAG: ATP-binding protein, partial [Oscillospiraceae bacterium]